MSITLVDADSVTKINTGTHPHGSVKVGRWDQARVTQRWFGTVGEVTFVGGKSVRELTCWMILTGYASHVALLTGMEVLNEEIGTSGTLTVTISGESDTTFSNVIFNGFEPEEDPWKDGSGVNGWQVKGTLNFRQVKS